MLESKRFASTEDWLEYRVERVHYQEKIELLELQLKKEQEYRQMLAETEGRYVDVLCNLIRKLSGVILTDRKDVILHLIRSGIADMEPAKHYIIRVASDDLLYVEGERML